MNRINITKTELQLNDEGSEGSLIVTAEDGTEYALYLEGTFGGERPFGVLKVAEDTQEQVDQADAEEAAAEADENAGGDVNTVSADPAAAAPQVPPEAPAAVGQELAPPASA